MRVGKNQLQTYSNELKKMSQFQGVNWEMILDTY
ncbi:hypothetical protein EAG11_04585 [Flavobacterium sp. 140616W15]|nr:hypothetical protein EAG11_04585 [Flavobacterium sp. 140616W15]